MGGLPIDSFTGAAGGRMFFFGNSRLWRTDGTPAGTIGVTSADVSFGPRAAPFGDGVLVVGGINVIDLTIARANLGRRLPTCLEASLHKPASPPPPQCHRRCACAG